MKYVEKKIAGQLLKIETGRIARQSNGSVLVTYGNTIVLATVNSAKEAREDVGFFPLQVEYREKHYAGGKIPGGFFKREARPGEHEILTSRVTDRPIRPLFPKGFKKETQVMSLGAPLHVLSYRLIPFWLVKITNCTPLSPTQALGFRKPFFKNKKSIGSFYRLVCQALVATTQSVSRFGSK